MIIFRKHDLIDGAIMASIFTHHTGEIGLHLNAKSGGVSTIFMLDKTESARQLAKMLIEAADAVDQPKQDEPTIEKRISDARQAGYEEGYKDATSEYEENS